MSVSPEITLNARHLLTLLLVMIRERAGEAFASGMVATGFWMGICLGRFILSFITPKLGEKFAVMVGDVLSVSWL